jgi:hypothetical protein
MNSPTVHARLDEIGIDLVVPERRSAQYLHDFVRSEIDKWAGPIKAAGVSADDDRFWTRLPPKQMFADRTWQTTACQPNVRFEKRPFELGPLLEAE